MTNKEILQRLLDTMLLPKLVNLENKQKGQLADLFQCDSLVKASMSNLLTYVEITLTPLPAPQPDLRSKSRTFRDSSKSVKASRPATPSSRVRKDSFGTANQPLKGRNQNLTTRKNLDNSLSILSQKTSQTTLKTSKR